MTLAGDNPIKCADEDVLNRTTYAQDIASTILELDRSEGIVVGVVGPWGSGKTSLLNLVKENLLSRHAIEAIEFNPWLFSSANDLINALLHELASRVYNTKYKTVGKNLRKYAALLAELAASYFGAGEAVSVTRRIIRRIMCTLTKKRPPLAELRRKIEEEMRALRLT